MMDRRRHAIAAVICAALLLCIFVSSAYIVHEAVYHHDCTGENCPICQFIAQIEQTRRGFGTRAVAAQVPARCTPVGRKIRLND